MNDAEKKDRVVYVDKALATIPEKVKVYINKKKTTYDTYEVDY